MELFVNAFRHSFFGDIGLSILAASLVLVRILSFVHFAPVFSHKSVPAYVRIIFAFLLTNLIADYVVVQEIPKEGYSLVYAIMVNIVLGFIMGFVSNLMFTTVVAGGEMMDSAMGFSAAQTFDPSLGSQTTIMGKFMGMLSIVVFFQVRGFEIMLEVLTNSFTRFSLYDPIMNINIAKIIHLSGDIINMGFLIVSPIVITILITDLVLGLISRAAPQINAFQISFTVKPTIGALIWLIIMPLFFTGLANLFLSPSRYF